MKPTKYANLHSSGILQDSGSVNNGGTTDYYQIKPQWKQAQDIIEDRNMNFAQGNILKAAFCFNTERHAGTNYERELNKIIWFCNRELSRINNLTEDATKGNTSNTRVDNGQTHNENEYIESYNGAIIW